MKVKDLIELLKKYPEDFKLSSTSEKMVGFLDRCINFHYQHVTQSLRKAYGEDSKTIYPVTSIGVPKINFEVIMESLNVMRKTNRVSNKTELMIVKCSDQKLRFIIADPNWKFSSNGFLVEDNLILNNFEGLK